MSTEANRWLLETDDALRANDPQTAVRHLARAVEASPHDARLLLQYGQLLLRVGRRHESLLAASRIDTIEPKDPAFHDALGTLLTHLEEPMQALPHFKAAVLGAPASHAMRYNLAMAQRMVGQLCEAEQNLDLVIAASPDDGEAYQARSDLRRQGVGHHHVPELERTLLRLKGRRASLPVAFALAKELEDLGEYRRSFAYLQAACRAQRASLRYDVAEDVAVLDKLRMTHTAGALKRLTSDFNNQECLFIIGLPRSGTTLVESIIGSHPDVFACGEIDAFPAVLIEQVTRNGTAAVRKLDFVDRALEVDYTGIGARYIDATRPRTGHTPKFTDKLPLNYLYAGLIHAALPNARFIALRRNPMDICYAMYKTLFASAYPFSYELSDLARYYRAWEDLMRHWEQILGDAWLNVQYEALVSEPTRIIPRVIEHCGLPWDAACLRFHERKTGVTTASAVQVRRPLYTDSVGKWQCYAQELAPLAQMLESEGVMIR